MLDHSLKIYISHASEDQAAADTLFQRLGDDGFEPWLCEISVRGSSKWREEMDKALHSADVFLFCVSQYSTSRYGQFVGEIERALELHRTRDDQSPAILPLRLDSYDIPSSLGMFMAVDYFSSGGYERLLDALHNLVINTSRYVISIHGIKTRGKWQKDVVPLLGQAGFVPVPLDYGNFLALQLLFSPSRNKRIEWFRDEYTRQCNRVGATRPSIIAHSLGSYIVAGAIAKYPEIKFDRIILCGAIVARSYPWQTYVLSRTIRAVLNQYGGNDFWARVVEWVVQDAGQSVLRGFDNPSPALTQQYRPQFGHSDYFYDLNYRDTWIPFLRGSVIKPEAGGGPIISNWRFMITRLIVLLLLIACGAAIAHLWITRSRETPSVKRQNYPALQPPDLEGHTWRVNIRSSGLPAFEGQTDFRADQTFEAYGKFLVPTQAANEHIDCPGSLKGGWSYVKDDRTVLGIQHMFVAMISDAGISKDQYAQCSSALQPLAFPNSTRISATCEFTSSTTCTSTILKLQLTPQ